DVILLGEMRDAETIKTAITAAETGHTVIATMHTKGAINAIDRVIDSFSSEYQAQVRFQLATVLKTVVSQQMLPDKSDNIIPAFEVMHITPAIRNMIRDNKIYQIENAVATGKNDGMLSMDSSILELYKKGLITKETAIDYADHPELIQRHIQGK
ncbi:MAG: type IV pili twitching motility protein PilT, partial [Ruminococcaceae bacterium]|nr:type IV pili twitching motility protein PilT [Oscillospiraceae bacterium]